jgi:uncharacterized protein HemY
MGKFLVVVGFVVVLLGVALMFFDKIPFLGKLPGDISIKRENFRIYFPITTSIILSVVISVLLWIFSQFKGR